MAGSTTRAALYKPGGGSLGIYGPDESADIDKLNDNFDKIDGLLGLKKVTSTTRPATPMDGQLIYETDTKILRYWNAAGTSWDRLASPVVSGLVPITPTSVSATLPAAANATINSDGSVSFSGATQVSVQGVFSADFKSYELEYELDSLATAGALQLRLQAGTTPAASASSYFFHANWGVTTTHTDADATLDRISLSDAVTSVQGGLGKSRIMSPFLPKITQFLTEFSRINSAGTAAGNGILSGWHSLGNSYDGFVLLASGGGAMAGTVRVRGLA